MNDWQKRNSHWSLVLGALAVVVAVLQLFFDVSGRLGLTAAKAEAQPSHQEPASIPKAESAAPGVGSPPPAQTPSVQSYPMANMSSSTDMAELRKPIDNIFRAWRDRDLDLYLRQWRRDAVRTSKAGKTQSTDELAEVRASQFSRYRAVEERHETCLGSRDDGRATVYVRYTMTYYRPAGPPISEDNIVERYDLVLDEASGGWLIHRNWDYQAGAGCTF